MKSKSAAIFLSTLVAAFLATPVPAQEIAGKGGMGVNAGVLKFNGGDWSDGSARLSGQVSFQYGFSNSLSLQLEAGGGWNNNGPDSSLVTGDDVLTVTIPITLGFLYRTQFQDSSFYPHLGVGGGIYQVGVKDSYRHYADSPNTGETLLWTSSGGYVKLGTDYFFSDSISMNFDVVWTKVMADEGDRFEPDDGDLSRYSDDDFTYTQFRAGVNYFFNLGSSDEPADLPDDGGDSN